MHEPTFRSACGRGGLNPFLMAMANIREHCSWVTVDPEAATDKAKALIHGAVLRAPYLEPLERHDVPVHPATLVIGGGIAGIQASLEVAGAGRPVILVEKSPSIGGHMARFDKTFPTLDCSACILTPKMVSVAQSPNITLMTYSEVEEISGFVGNFKVKIRRKSRPVDAAACNGCGACWEACPSAAVPRRRQLLLDGRPVATSDRIPRRPRTESPRRPRRGPRKPSSACARPPPSSPRARRPPASATSASSASGFAATWSGPTCSSSTSRARTAPPGASPLRAPSAASCAALAPGSAPAAPSASPPSTRW